MPTTEPPTQELACSSHAVFDRRCAHAAMRPEKIDIVLDPRLPKRPPDWPCVTFLKPKPMKEGLSITDHCLSGSTWQTITQKAGNCSAPELAYGQAMPMLTKPMRHAHNTPLVLPSRERGKAEAAQIVGETTADQCHVCCKTGARPWRKSARYESNKVIPFHSCPADIRRSTACQHSSYPSDRSTSTPGTICEQNYGNLPRPFALHFPLEIHCPPEIAFSGRLC